MVIFKAKQSGDGHMLKLNISSKNKDGKTRMYLSFTKQTGFNNATGKGSFRGAGTDPAKHINMSLTAREAGHIIAILNSPNPLALLEKQKGGRWSEVHKYNNGTTETSTTVSLGAIKEQDGTFKMFYIGAQRGENKFGVSLDAGEAVMVSEYLKANIVELMESGSEDEGESDNGSSQPSGGYQRQAAGSSNTAAPQPKTEFKAAAKNFENPDAGGGDDLPF
jgi:hypothetical protein